MSSWDALHPGLIFAAANAHHISNACQIILTLGKKTGKRIKI
jgi:hypothetical protein